MGMGVLEAKFLEAMYENKLELPGGGGCKTKNLPWGEYGYFLELHISSQLLKVDAFTFYNIQSECEYNRSVFLLSSHV